MMDTWMDDTFTNIHRMYNRVRVYNIKSGT